MRSIIPSIFSVAGMNLCPNTYKTKVPWERPSLECFIRRGCACPPGIIFVSYSALPTQIKKVYPVAINASNPTNLCFPFIISLQYAPLFSEGFFR